MADPIYDSLTRYVPVFEKSEIFNNLTEHNRNIWQGPCVLIFDKYRFDAEGIFSYTFFPGLSLEGKILVNKSIYYANVPDSCLLEIKLTHSLVKKYRIRFRYRSTSAGTFSGEFAFVDDLLLIQREKFLSRAYRTIADWLGASPTVQAGAVVFHIFNFRDYQGYGSVQNNEGKTTLFNNRLLFESANFFINLYNIPNNKELYDFKKQTGGFHITNIAYLIPKDTQSKFTISEIKSQLEIHDLFWGFLKGHKVISGFVSGFNEDMEWQFWQGNKFLQPERPVDTWANVFYQKEIQDIYPEFIKIISEDAFQLQYRMFINLYLDANANDTDFLFGISQCQIIFEGLSWIIFVSKGTESPGTFKDVKAGKKIDMLLGWLHLSTNIADLPPSLQALAALEHFTSIGPTLAFIRNKYMHPRDGTRVLSFDSEELKDAWAFTINLTVLLILRLCSYKGRYYDRMKKKQEVTPWP